MEKRILTPEEFYGHQIGADRKLARWDKIVEYFWHLDASPCVKVVELGKTTDGHPFLLAVISSPDNLKDLERIRETNWRLAHPKGLSEKEIDEMVSEGKAVVSMTMSVHASEIGGTQTSSELAHELATSSDPELVKIRENTVLLLIPSANPDGNMMVVDWYNKYLGTEYEGGPLPYLYNRYIGHDNNRDAFHITQVESKILTKFFFRDWYPQAQIDFHHMGSYGARFYIPPHMDPLFEFVDPLVWAEQQLYGGMMMLELEAAGKTGIETQATYPADGGPYWDESPVMHGICGMLTESASANLATPNYVHYQQLGAGRGRPEYRTQMSFPHPWPGGWWRLRDVVEQQKIAAFAALKAAANMRERILKNMYLKAKRQIEAGSTKPPYAFIFSPKQHDTLVALKLLDKLHEAGVEVHRAETAFECEGSTYPKGTYVVFSSQIARPYIFKLMKQTFYHDGPWSRSSDGSPLAPYDYATSTLNEFWGVKVVAASEPLKGDFRSCASIRYPRGKVEASKDGYLLDPRINRCFAVVNALLKNGRQVYRVTQPVQGLPAGAFYVPEVEGQVEELEQHAARHHLTFHAVKSPDFERKPVRQLRIGLYKRYWGGNMQEGWIRWLFEQEYGFPYNTLLDSEVKAGSLAEKYDVLLFPSDAKCYITGEGIEEHNRKTNPKYVLPKYPPDYKSGIGKEGVEKTKEFVEAGGTIIAIGEATELAIDELKLPIRNVLKELKPKEYFCPGSTLKVSIDMTHPLTYGVAEDCLVLQIRSSPAFEIGNTAKNEDYRVIVSFPEERMMESGWLIGEKNLSNKASLIEAKAGKGRAILFGFSPEARAITEGTFKFLFNALLG